MLRTILSSIRVSTIHYITLHAFKAYMRTCMRTMRFIYSFLFSVCVCSHTSDARYCIAQASLQPVQLLVYKYIHESFSLNLIG